MSPMDARSFRAYNRFPRVSGDEPSSRATSVTAKLFSPRERG